MNHSEANNKNDDSRDQTSRSSRRWAWVVAVILVVVLILLGLRCREDSANSREVEYRAMLVPDQVPEMFSVFEPDEIIQFCDSYTESVEYEGVARGAYGTLWAGGGNPVDRLLLTGEILNSRGFEVRIHPGEGPRLWYLDQSWKSVELVEGRYTVGDKPLDPEAVELGKVADALGDRVHRIGFAFELYVPESDAGPDEPARVQEIASPLTLAECTFQPIVVSVSSSPSQSTDEGADELAGTRYELRVDEGVVLDSGSLSGVSRVRLRVDWHFGGETKSYFRELFDLANGDPAIPGHALPNEEDRYVVAIGSGPLSAEVLDTRKRMLLSENYTPVADPWERSLLLLATRFMQDVDKVSKGLTQTFEVSYSGVEPRVVITAAEVVGAETVRKRDGDRLSMSMDVVHDQVSVTGPQSRYFQVARSLSLDEIETRVLYDATKKPVVSCSSVLSQFKSGESTSIVRRIEMIRDEIVRIFQRESIGSRLVIKATGLVERAEANASPELTLERVENGVRVHGLVESDDAEIGGVLWQPGKSVTLEREPEGIAAIVEAHLRNQMGTYLFRLEGQFESSWQPKGLDVVDGSCLTYRVSGPEFNWNQVVFVSMKSGSPSGVWFDIDSDQTSTEPLPGQWPNVLPTDRSRGMRLDGLTGPGAIDDQGVAEVFQLEVGGETRLVRARRIVLERESKPDVEVVLLPAGNQSLVLEVKSGTEVVSLESATPVLKGHVLDADTRQPISMATVVDQEGAGSARSSLDGSFRISLGEPLKPRLILVLDESRSMNLGIDVDSESVAPVGEQRIDYVRNAVAKLLDDLPANVEVALWSFNTSKRYYGKYKDPDLVKTRHEFSVDRGSVLEELKALQPNGGTPLTAVVKRLDEFLGSDPLSRGATIVVLADGANSCKVLSAEAAYEDMHFRVPIHTIGFAVQAEGEAVDQLQKLSEISGGVYQRVGTESELVGAFERLERDFENVGVSVTSGYHQPTKTKAVASGAEVESLEVLMEPGGKKGELLHISKSNREDLGLCEGLSPKAVTLIQDRIESGEWEVLIPNQRTNVGFISAYAWVEIEPETGRCIGRTEDGLHGSLAIDGEWPKVSLSPTVKAAGKVSPIINYAKGVAAHAAASTVAAMKWHHQPGFLEADSVDFMNYVMINALINVYQWHKEVGLVLKMPVDRIPTPSAVAVATLSAEEAFWAGVGTSMELQRIAAIKLKNSTRNSGDK